MTIKEAQELVAAWNAKNSASSECGILPRDILQDPGRLFWELLSVSTACGTDLTEALIAELEKKNSTL